METNLLNSLTTHFERFRANVIGNDQFIETPYGSKKLVYADWTASGRLYREIEQTLQDKFGPYVANTHTETSFTGTLMTKSYHHAQEIIKNHFNASDNDILICSGSGMTNSVNKLIRLLNWRVPEGFRKLALENMAEEDRPVVFVSVMEHHSNEITWRESIADVQYIPTNRATHQMDEEAFEELLDKYSNRKIKVAAVCSYSNVTGTKTEYEKVATIMHRNGGYCFVDFAASAPYVDIDMHPKNSDERLDAIYLSPHKFLGGPGTTGVLIFNKELYHNSIPDEPGGGTVKWVNRWGEHRYFDELTTHGIEAREDGGTPPFLQVIKTALAIKLKEEMGIDNILKREKEQNKLVFDRLKQIKNLKILAQKVEDRLSIFSFHLLDYPHDYNLFVKLLNDHYGIQVRGGCACAGPYGHFLLNIDYNESQLITQQIDGGDDSCKPGWVRVSLHPIMSDEEIHYIMDAVEDIAANFGEMRKDYCKVKPSSTEWRYKKMNESDLLDAQVSSLFEF